MNKIILSVNESKIEIETAACENAKYFAQRLFGALKEIGCEPTSLQELQKIISSSDVNDYIKSRIISQQEAEQPLEVLGMPINSDKLKDLITVPNAAEIISLIKEFDSETIEAFRYLTFSGDVFSIIPSFIQDITEKNTVYTVGDRQTQTAQKLISLRDSMNDWLDFIGVNSNNYLVDISGLQVGEHIGRYSLDIGYIQRIP